MAGGGDWSVDWAPRNALRVPALADLDPDVRFVHVVRDPRRAISSLVEAWRSGRFVSEPGLPGWWGEPWSFPLIPGWRELAGRPLHEVAAVQWLTIEQLIREDLAQAGMPSSLVTYEALVADPVAEITRVASELDVPWSGSVPDPLPASPFTVSAPDGRKWQRDISEVLAAYAEHPQLHAGFLDWADQVGVDEYREPLGIEKVGPAASSVTRSSAGTPFKSDHTSTFVELLSKAHSSLVITTYKSGHVILARTAGSRLDTAPFGFDRPMGVAVAGGRLAIGTGQSIDTFSNQPGLAGQVDHGAASDRPKHDAVFAPRSITFTGDIAIHEMDYDRDGTLWFVNTKFSCLCTHDLHNSFVSAWTPPWITALAAEDRCHLNGLAMVDGRPRYVTALSRTNTPGGWREHKGTSGLILDITTNEPVAEGLSMPHSPRWYDNRLWVLQSGKGTLSTVDPRTGAIVGMLRFDGAVQEIFDVAVLPEVTWPTLLGRGDITANAYVLAPSDLAKIRR